MIANEVFAEKQTGSENKLDTFCSPGYSFCDGLLKLKIAMEIGDGQAIENILPNIIQYTGKCFWDESILNRSEIYQTILNTVNNFNEIQGISSYYITKKEVLLFLLQCIEKSSTVALIFLQNDLLNVIVPLLTVTYDTFTVNIAKSIILDLIDYKGDCSAPILQEEFVDIIDNNLTTFNDKLNDITREDRIVIEANIDILAKITSQEEFNNLDFQISVINIFAAVAARRNEETDTGINASIARSATELSKSPQPAAYIISSGLAEILIEKLYVEQFVLAWLPILMMCINLTNNIVSGSDEYSALLSIIDFPTIVKMFVDFPSSGYPVAALELMNNLITDVADYAAMIDGNSFFEVLSRFYSTTNYEQRKSVMRVCFALACQGNEDFTVSFIESPMCSDVIQGLSDAGDFIQKYAIFTFSKILHRIKRNNIDYSPLLEILQGPFLEFLNDVVDSKDSGEVYELASEFAEEINRL